MSNRPNPRRHTAANRRPVNLDEPSRTPKLLLALGAVAVLLAVVALVAGGASDDGDDVVTDDVEQTRPVAVDGSSLPELTGEPDEAVGTPAPALRGRSFDGTAMTIGDDARPRVIMFLAHWCSHCQAEVPRLASWVDANGMPEDVDLYAVATGTSQDQPNYPPSAWLEREGFSIPTLADDAEGTAAAAYGVASFPFFVVVDADGVVVARTSGELNEAQWEGLIDQARA